MTYNAVTISNFIVNYSIGEGKPITNLKLQKILYFLQLQFLGKESKKLFENDIEKWKLGPVVPDVYHEYKMFGSNPINFPVKILIEEEKVEFEDELEIRKIVENLIDTDSFELVDRTHEHTPWKEEMDAINSGLKGLKYSLKELNIAYKEDIKLND